MNKNTGNMVDEELLIRYLANNVTDLEKEKVEEWLKRSPENEAQLEQVRKIWKHAEAIEDFQSIDTNQDWLRVREKIGFDQKKNQIIELKPVRSSFYYIVRVAAVLIIIIATGLLLNIQFNFISFGKSEWVAMTTDSEKKDMTLPDGTRVLLNEQTKISYPLKFKKRVREVKLEGEAFFEVVSDHRTPFLVDAGNDLFIEVLGTSFTVRTREEENKVIVFVESGKVAFYIGKNRDNEIVLQQNEQGMYHEDVFTKSTIKDINFNSWRTNILTFKQTPFFDVVLSLEYHFKKPFKLLERELDTLQLTTTFQDQSLPDILEEIKTVLHVDYTLSNDTIFLFRSEEQK